MSVVAPPSTNTNVGNSGAGGSVTQLSPIAWATSNISINTIQNTNLYPNITSGTQRSFSWFHGKKFRVLQISSNNVGAGTVSFTYPGGSNSGRSFRYDTYSYVQATAVAIYPAVFVEWQIGDTFIGGVTTLTLYDYSYTGSIYYNAVAIFTTP
jgi:hypothetical protein